MATEIDSDAELGVTKLVGGIVQDARELFVEQMTLFQVEIRNDLHRALGALMPVLIGLSVVLAGIVLLGIGGAILLAWAVPAIPAWLAYLLVGAGTLFAGGLLVLWGKSVLDTISLTPDTALKGLKENIQWKTKN